MRIRVFWAVQQILQVYVLCALIKLKFILLWIEAAAGALPRDPVGRPSLIPEQSTERAGQFIIDLSGAAPRPQRGEHTRTTSSAVTFLFRFEEMTTQNVSYIWTVSATESEFQFMKSRI